MESTAVVELPAQLSLLRAKAVADLSKAMEVFFHVFDKALNETSASPDAGVQRQEECLELIRVLRPQARTMIKQFGEMLEQRFHQLARPRRKSSDKSPEFSFDNLTLVDEDAMEITIAITSIVSKARGRYGASLSHLMTRLQHMLPKAHVDDSSNPLDPNQIVSIMVEVLRALEMSLPVRLMALRMIDSTVLNALGDVLDDANQDLAAAGVMPQIRSVARPSPEGRKSAAVASSPGAAASGADQLAQTVSSLQSLMASLRGGLPQQELPAALNDRLAGQMAPAAAGSAGSPASGSTASGSGASSAATTNDWVSPEQMAQAMSSLQGLMTSVRGALPQGLPVLPAGADAAHLPAGVSLPQEAFMPGGQVMPFLTAAPYPVAELGAPALPTRELMGLLHELQDRRSEQYRERDECASADVVESLPAEAVVVRNEIAELIDVRVAEGNVAEGNKAVSQADDDVINLLSMLFDFILDDEDLPTAIKALLARLQIPLLKVAIVDQSFFAAELHPARRLLNMLARAGIGWNSSDQKSDDVFRKIEEVVYAVLNDFDDDIHLFADLLDDFNRFMEPLQKRTEVVENRTREAEEGRTRAELARILVLQTLNRRMAGKDLPMVAVELLQEGWSKVLYAAAIREGTDSNDWKQAIKVVDVLIWSVLPQSSDELKERLRALVPKLNNSLKKGLAAVSYDSFLVETWLRQLQQIHGQLLRNEKLKTVSVVSQVSEARQAVSVKEAIAHPDAVIAVVLPEEPVVQPRSAAHGQVTENVLAVIDKLQVGQWLEFAHEGMSERRKLAAFIRSVGKLVFVNRKGIRSGDYFREDLALEIQSGRVRIIDDGLLFDKALENVVGSLRSIGQSAKVSAHKPA